MVSRPRQSRGATLQRSISFIHDLDYILFDDLTITMFNAL